VSSPFSTGFSSGFGSGGAASTIWIEPLDVATFLGIPPAETVDDDWLAQCTAASNTVAFRRRAASGYTDYPTVVPDEAVRTGCVLYAASLYRERGAVDGFSSFVELGQVVGTGGSWAQVQKLWGVNRMAVG
jgi:hypothetical protein